MSWIEIYGVHKYFSGSESYKVLLGIYYEAIRLNTLQKNNIIHSLFKQSYVQHRYTCKLIAFTFGKKTVMLILNLLLGKVQ